MRQTATDAIYRLEWFDAILDADQPAKPASPIPQVGFELSVLSYGIGQDSWALLVKKVEDESFNARYPSKRFLVIASETGAEHPESYDHLAYTKQYCQYHNVEFVHLTPDMGFHSPGWQYLEHQWEQHGTIGSKAFVKSCTDRLKIVPLYRYLEWWLGQNYNVPVGRKEGFRAFASTYGRIGMMIGFTKGEEKRVAGPSDERWRQESIQMLYPLIDLGMTRGDCQNYLRSRHQPVPIPSNCMMCCWMSDIELLWLYRHYPQVYQRWVEHEARKLEANRDKGESNLGVFGKKTLPEVLAEAQVKYADWSDGRIDEYKMSHGHNVCSKY